jgi:hypothetical protein
MSALKLQQKCPMCDEMLDYMVQEVVDRVTIENTSTLCISAVTTPESTAHVWTHAPKEEA